MSTNLGFAEMYFSNIYPGECVHEAPSSDHGRLITLRSDSDEHGKHYCVSYLSLAYPSTGSKCKTELPSVHLILSYFSMSFNLHFI